MAALDASLSSFRSAGQELSGRDTRLTPSEVTQTYKGTKLITSFEDFTEYTKGYLDGDALEYVHGVLGSDAYDVAELKKAAQLVRTEARGSGRSFRRRK